MNETVLLILGVVLILIGIWLVITGAPGVTLTGGGIWPIIKDLPKRFIAGVALIILGGWLAGANVGPILGNDEESPSPSVSSAPSSAPSGSAAP